MSIAQKENALISIRDENNEKIIMQIYSENNEIKLEVDESLSKNDLAYAFWQSILDFIPKESHEQLKIKCILVKCFHTMKEVATKNLIDLEKTDDQGEGWREAYNEAEGLFY